MQAFWQGVHARTSDWRTHGFIRGIMRSVLQLRTPQNGKGDQHSVSGLNGAAADSPVDNLPSVRFREPQIEMAHGAGGKASRRLVEGLFAPLLFSSTSEPLGDAAHLDFGGTRIAITTDSFVVKPLSFPGGSIGELAVNGTVNDLAVSGARAEAMVVTYVLEAGLSTPLLEAEVRAMGNAARKAGVTIAGGDTKVVEHGKADSMYITTTGIGRPLHRLNIDPRSVRPGDRILLSGPIGDHGITILLARGELDLEADLRSDTRSVLPLVEELVKVAAPGIRWMRDPTRGGVATSLNELVRDCGFGVVLLEEMIPMHDAVRGACELLGLDPLHIANEGQFLAVVSPEYADAALNALSLAPGGEDAQIIGEVREQTSGAVLVTTRYGGSRIVDMLVGDPLPRIC
jgi:hydrogenase expression/formation protein HypE